MTAASSSWERGRASGSLRISGGSGSICWSLRGGPARWTTTDDNPLDPVARASHAAEEKPVVTDYRDIGHAADAGPRRGELEFHRVAVSPDGGMLRSWQKNR